MLRKAKVHAMPALIDMADHVPPASKNAEIRSTEDGTINMFATTKVGQMPTIWVCRMYNSSCSIHFHTVTHLSLT